MPEVPNYIAANARRGLEYQKKGYGGNGLVQQTIDEALALARGEASEDKIIRANAWAARHAKDLQAPQNNNQYHPNYPGPGAVAHLLWGISPTNPDMAKDWYRRESRRIQQARALAEALTGKKLD